MSYIISVRLPKFTELITIFKSSFNFQRGGNSAQAPIKKYWGVWVWV